jgi:hypothetical protein
MSVAQSVLLSLGAAMNISLALSQVPLLIQMMKEGVSDSYSWMPSLALSVTLSLWSTYTVWFLPLPQLYAANFCGFIIPFLYLMCFAAYASTWQKKCTIFFTSVIAVGATWAFGAGVFLGGNTQNPVSVVTGVTATSNVLFFLAPLYPLYLALKELDVSRVSLTLSCVQVVQSVVWIAGGALVPDFFIVAINAVGMCFAFIQIASWCYITVMAKSKEGAAPKEAAQQQAVKDGEAVQVEVPQSSS